MKKTKAIIKQIKRNIILLKNKIKKNKHFWKNVLLFAAGIMVLIIGITVIWLSTLQIPDFRAFQERKIENSTKIYDRTGKVLLYDLSQDVRKTDITFEEMGANIKNATLAIEDAEFYNHGGIRISSIIRAVLINFFSTGPTQGGSTITQQLVKNTLLTSQKSYTRKIKEWVLAIKIDKVLPKDKIFEYYLNENPYGGTIYGIEEASQIYFNKNASELSVAEAAYLAAIPQSPTILSPYGKHKDKLEVRKNLVLGRELELKFITERQYDQAKSEIVAFMPQANSGIKAPHFVFFIKDYLEEKYGSDLVDTGGLKVTTTLDYDLQSVGEQIVKEGALSNEKKYNATNAALVAIDPKTGQILTMIGSRDYFDKNIDGNFNVTTALRQPGSSFKPFIYATAFNKGFTPSTVLFDLPTEFQTTCDAYGKALPGYSQGDCYMPQDFDGKFRGPMSLHDALAQSINIPAVKLFYLVGQKQAADEATAMGISTLTDPSRYGLTLVIGGGEVMPLDITSAYGVFANNGVKNPYTGILKVEDQRGNILEEYTPNSTEVLSKNTALMISDILSDNVARAPTFGANSALNIPGKDVATKTGTTNNDKDAWTVGYTPSITVGVWAGNNDNKKMKSGGSAIAAPIWNKFMVEALKKFPDETFEEPDLYIDPQTTKPILRGVWQGDVHSILYWVDKSDITGPLPANPSDDPQFNHWEIPVQNWWAQNKNRYPATPLDTPQALPILGTPQ
ncbi:MAG TPA: PBP1A family penicillin-binding protein [Candidatus Paceibacterota bacterium]|jgi:1A family penicillin-binding protein|nr:PBP1A family penicillin-binding protein [Candidatus Paceibacterota bacterium]